MPNTNIPLVDLGRQYAAIGSELETAILDVLRTTRFVAGPRVAAFEQEFAALLCELIFGQNTKFQETLQKTVKAPVALR